MPTPQIEKDAKRRDPYDPRTGATGNDEPNELERAERASPGSGEDEQEDAADLQPNDVENGDTAR